MAGSPSMEQIASLYAEELDSTFGARPAIFGGYCLSGMIAFEISRQWAQERRAAPVLLLDVRAPQRYWERSFLRSNHGAGRYVAYQGKRWLSLPGERKSALIREWTAEIGTRLLTGRDRDVKAGNIAEVFFNAARSYRPAAYPGHVVLLRASIRPEEDEDLGWSAFAANVDVYALPCTHADMLRTPHAIHAAGAVNGVLESYAEPGRTMAAGRDPAAME